MNKQELSPAGGTVRIRPADQRDTTNIWNWRNDVKSREMSATVEPIPFDDHVVWFQASLINPNRKLFIAFATETESIGLCRFDYDSTHGEATVSLVLNPQFRGHGLGRHVLHLGLSEYRQSTMTKIIALIRPNNTASLRTFVGCGFQPTGTQGELLRYEFT